MSAKDRILVLNHHDTTGPYSFGGIPFSLISAINNLDYCAEGVYFAKNIRYHKSKIGFYATQLIRGESPRGWMFSKNALNFRRAILNQKKLNAALIISLFQIQPKTSSPYVLYIDCTLGWFFKTYPEGKRLSKRLQRDALALELDTYRNSRHIYVTSQKFKNELSLQYDIDPQKISILHYSANNIYIPKKPKSFSNFRKETLNVLFIGKDAHRKGLDIAIEFVKILIKNGIKVKLHVVGCQDIFRKNRHDSELDNVIFHGFQPNNSPIILQLLKDCHIGVLPSREEASGISLIEYQLAGMIAIGSGVGGMRDNAFTSTTYFDPSENLKEICEILVKSIYDGEFEKYLRIAFDEIGKVPNWDQISKSILHNSKW